MVKKHEFPDISVIQAGFAKVLQERLDCGLSNVYRNKDGVIVRETSDGIVPLGQENSVAAE